MKKILAFAALLFSGLSFAQSADINDYKYVIIPEKFEFLKEPNKYNLNQLTKMLFEKQGFEVYYPNESLPQDLNANKCRALYGSLEDESGMLSTSLEIILKDCSGKELYRSAKGKSKQKDFQKGYYESLRNASADMQANLNYKYTGKDPMGAALASQQTPTPQAAPKPAEPAPVAAQPQQVVNEATLFAQPITNGYQLVDSTPKVVLKIYKTSQADSYTAMGDGKNGVVFKKGNEWFFEYYQDDNLVSEKLDIKF
ncbi:hypothetical protein AM493_10640 [Flavobacterium akiainvivens]|uniref:Uncharacterized protein n=1 Tax=Flavobacterium akiainvivens TaxID=1202724 RepID=A0A0M9VI91_9FLAO|nr:hypothetical protein [Flavobacterium akiainvivens]KOS06440.1 hypothetical protein AM493_10640 [Flavobacterium akiainvivens]SFQ13503.1 hypothetical protein SAMN05444144_101234 [Flavobacterium akiainvivens]